MRCRTDLFKIHIKSDITGNHPIVEDKMWKGGIVHYWRAMSNTESSQSLDLISDWKTDIVVGEQ